MSESVAESDSLVTRYGSVVDTGMGDLVACTTFVPASDLATVVTATLKVGSAGGKDSGHVSEDSSGIESLSGSCLTEIDDLHVLNFCLHLIARAVFVVPLWIFTSENTVLFVFVGTRGRGRRLNKEV